MAELGSSRFRQATFADRSEAESFLSGITPSISSPRFGGDPNAFYFRYAGVALGSCALHRGEHSELTFDVARAGEYHLMFPQRHGLRYTTTDRALHAQAQRSALLLPPRQSGHCEVPSGTSGISLVMQAPDVRAHAEKMSDGDGDGRPLRFASDAMLLDLSDPVAVGLSRNVFHAFYEMQKLSTAGLSRLAAADLDDLLLGFVCAVLSGDVRRRLSEPPADVGQSVVRRARDYIESQAAEPIRLADLAQTLGISLRALQIGFRRQFGCSPREFLMTCRLELARARLVSADAKTRVATVAFDCGFSDLTVFAQKYRQTFGELPSETLKRRG